MSGPEDEDDDDDFEPNEEEEDDEDAGDSDYDGDDPAAMVFGAEPGDCLPGHSHKWACTGTAYGGDDERYHGEGRSYCEHCGADGDG